MKRTDSSLSSDAHETDFFRFPLFVTPACVCCNTNGGVPVDGGVDTTGDSLRAFMDLSASWNGSMDDGCATPAPFAPGSRLTVVPAGGGGAFLKLGSLGFGFGAEKNEKSDLASLTAVSRAGFVSFFTTTGLDDEAVPTAGFFGGGGAFNGASLSFRFFGLTSTNVQSKQSGAVFYAENQTDVTHPLPYCYLAVSYS